MNLGAHMSIAGGLDKACERARETGIRVMQIFVKNERQWAAKPLTDAEIAAYRKAFEANDLTTTVVHSSYLINLASPNRDLWARSISGFRDELDRCEAIGAKALIFHPGSPGESGEESGVRQTVRALDEIHAATRGYKTRVLLETSAGQGATLGRTFEGLGRILDSLKEPERAGVCFDTCHVFAAGYELRTRAGHDATFEAFDKAIGLNRLEAFHINDSKKDLGCRVDRHEHIGKGCMGRKAFDLLMKDRRFADRPMVIETPKEDDMDLKNLKLLRGMRKKK